MPVHQALAAYEVRKTEIVNAEISRLRESTQVLNGYEKDVLDCFSLAPYEMPFL